VVGGGRTRRDRTLEALSRKPETHPGAGFEGMAFLELTPQRGNELNSSSVNRAERAKNLNLQVKN